MLYREIQAGKTLEKVIKCFWMLQHDYREEQHTHEHLWADANGELIFSFGEPYYLKTASGKQVLPRNFVIGPFKKELRLYSDGFTGFVAVRFKAWGIYPFAREPMTTLVNNIADAETVFGDSIKRISRQMADKKPEEKISLLQGYFELALSETDRKKMASMPIAMKIMEQKGVARIADIIKEFRVNARQLERIFKTETGLSAKVFARIIRFNHAKNLIQKNCDISLAQLTYETGYSDQAHFSRNFREMFDISPGEFKRQMGEFMKNRDAYNMDVAFVQD
ncbi:MAG: AraC family transcriptional regulator [Chitinophagaceae bacterium]|nr:AraC family transcriptional regulator [Chitinophagaceae bacterium]